MSTIQSSCSPFPPSLKNKRKMALNRCFACNKNRHFGSITVAQSSNNNNPRENLEEGRSASAAEQFAPLELTFRRRLTVGIGSASLVAVGANFAGITSFLLGLSPESSRSLKLDVVYPIQGYSRCFEASEGFVGYFISKPQYILLRNLIVLRTSEFIYPANWVGDQRLLYRAAEKKEFERSLDPPPLTNSTSDRRRRNVNEPVVAFGPPGSSGELNVSVIVSPVPLDFS